MCDHALGPCFKNGMCGLGPDGFTPECGAPVALTGVFDRPASPLTELGFPGFTGVKFEFATDMFTTGPLVCKDGVPTCDSPNHFSPRRPPRPPPTPPSIVDPCSEMTCPSAPNMCYLDSACQAGRCLEPMAKPTGTPCDDLNEATIGDSCNRGRCNGAGSSCNPQSLLS